MNAKDMLKNGQSFFRGFLPKQKHTKQSEKVSPIIFVGSWQLQLSDNARIHSLVIGPDLTVNIDHRTIPAQVESLTSDSLVLLDHYGYHITIQADNDVPVQLFDEADDVYYVISPVQDQ